ncbi:MAG: hypothetical protein J6X66_02910 [Lachnospiraceae bacterium]|nr:hypothetical protein [Lachnospiraceae bacterium]
MITIRFGRRSLSMGDDVNNGIYTIEIPDDATLGELIGVIMNGGNGNTWPIPSTSTCWNLYSNIGRIADIIPDKKQIDYINRDEGEPLSSLGIKWIFGGHEEKDLDIAFIERSHFR